MKVVPGKVLLLLAVCEGVERAELVVVDEALGTSPINIESIAVESHRLTQPSITILIHLLVKACIIGVPLKGFPKIGLEKSSSNLSRVGESRLATYVRMLSDD